ncbi:hypothetical protein [Sulfitobacter sp. 1A12779]|uniref:hypothetical protein n=1 Tax=Sulfitobacter sp. 1A12779 TaxID=3368599 RepID=UPI0037470435
MATPDHNRTDHVDHTNTTTTTTTTDRGGNSGLAFIVGAVVVVVALLAYFLFAGGDLDGANDVNVNIEGAAESTADAVDEAATPTE